MRIVLATLLVLFSLTACGEREAPAPEASETAAPAPPPDAAPAAPEAITPLPAAPPQGIAPPEPEPELGRLLYSTNCLSCHGATGQGMGPFPKLAGQTREALAAKLIDYRAGKTLGPQTAIMTPFAQAMSDAEIAAVAEYIAAF